MSENTNSDQHKPRKRGVTELTLGWIAEKLRKTETIKEQLASGTYKVNSEKVAAAILNEDK